MQESLKRYWYRAKQIVIPVAGLAFLAGFCYTSNRDAQIRETREENSQTYSAPADIGIDRYGNLKSSTRPEDFGL